MARCRLLFLSESQLSVTYIAGPDLGLGSDAGSDDLVEHMHLGKVILTRILKKKHIVN